MTPVKCRHGVHELEEINFGKEWLHWETDMNIHVAVICFVYVKCNRCPVLSMRRIDRFVTTEPLMNYL